MKKRSLLYRAARRLGIIALASKLQREWISKNTPHPSSVGEFSWEESLVDPTRFYNRCVAYFDNQLDPRIKSHRAFFSVEKRGFGEDAFHVMWLMLVEKYRPAEFLEIGVYRGQVLSLVSLLQDICQISGNVTGISPFERVGDAASLADYGYCRDWMNDTYANFKRFQLREPHLVKSLSTDEKALETIRGRQWDMIYIDGNHDYEVVARDWHHCRNAVRVGGIIVLDDSALGTNFRPPLFATSGFEGPSQLADSLDGTNFRHILQVGHNRVLLRMN